MADFVIPAQAGIQVFVIPAQAGIQGAHSWMRTVASVPDQVAVSRQLVRG